MGQPLETATHYKNDHTKSHETAPRYLCESLLIALGFLAEGEELEVLGGLHPTALLLLRLLHLLTKQNMKKHLKGTVSRDFLLLVCLMNQFPPSPGVFHKDRFEKIIKFF